MGFTVVRIRQADFATAASEFARSCWAGWLLSLANDVRAARAKTMSLVRLGAEPNQTIAGQPLLAGLSQHSFGENSRPTSASAKIGVSLASFGSTTAPAAQSR